MNGKSAVEWIMDRHRLATDKDSGITNNPNDWAAEHDGAGYILYPLNRIISASLETRREISRLNPE